jgi:hypothetical protein
VSVNSPFGPIVVEREPLSTLRGLGSIGDRASRANTSITLEMATSSAECRDVICAASDVRFRISGRARSHGWSHGGARTRRAPPSRCPSLYLRLYRAENWTFRRLSFLPKSLYKSVVGAVRFELTTTGTPCRYATRLRYAPWKRIIADVTAWPRLPRTAGA